jgi:hypothetical protein
MVRQGAPYSFCPKEARLGRGGFTRTCTAPDTAPSAPERSGAGTQTLWVGGVGNDRRNDTPFLDCSYNQLEIDRPFQF